MVESSIPRVPPINLAPDQLYPQDMEGEVCDAATRLGGMFVQGAVDGDYYVEPARHAPNLLPIDYNPRLVREGTDIAGVPTLHLPFRLSAQRSRRIIRLAPELPSDYMLYQIADNGERQAVGIRLHSIPVVREMVRAAVTLPKQGLHYVSGALVLSSDDQRHFLELFDRALHAPDPSQQQPAAQRPKTALRKIDRYYQLVTQGIAAAAAAGLGISGSLHILLDKREEWNSLATINASMTAISTLLAIWMTREAYKQESSV